MKLIRHLWQYLIYFFKSSTEHGLHSPFIYELYTRVIRDQKNYYVYDDVESIRSSMLLSNKEIMITDFGTGGRNSGKDRKIKVSEIASHHLKSKKYGQLLFRLGIYLKPKNVIELGTSLGVTTLYLASSIHSKIYTLEGSPATAEIAQKNFQRLKKEIHSVVGEFSQTLPDVLSQVETVDLIFFDGNHNYKSSLEYFELCKEKADGNTVFIFDDIHWSAEMEMAWMKIIADEKVTASIDLFALGIVFFRKEQLKQHFILRY